MVRQVTPPRPTVLVTRPAAQAETFARELAELNADILISPVMEIVALAPHVVLQPNETLLITSRNALLSIDAAQITGARAHVVGTRSSELARRIGVEVLSVSEDADALVETLKTAKPAAFLHLRGQHTTGEIAPRLREQGHEVREAVTYDQRALALNQTALHRLTQPEPIILPLFSPRSARILADQLAETPINAPLYLVSISANVDAAWHGPVAASRCHADTADAAAMMDAIRMVLAALT